MIEYERKQIAEAMKLIRSGFEKHTKNLMNLQTQYESVKEEDRLPIDKDIVENIKNTIILLNEKSQMLSAWIELYESRESI